MTTDWRAFLKRYGFVLLLLAVVIFAYQFGKDRALRDNGRDERARAAAV